MSDAAGSCDLLEGHQEMITDPLTHFMRCRSELAEFVTFYHNMAAKAFRWEQPDFDPKLYEEYLGQSIFFLENYLIRFSGLVDIYLEETIIDLAFASTDFLSEDEIEKAANRLRSRLGAEPTKDAALYEAAKTLTRGSKLDIAKEIENRCGIKLAACGDGWREVLLLNQIRNIIIHNSSEVDEKFQNVCHDLGYEFCPAIGEMFLIPEPEVMRITGSAQNWVWAFDSEISKRPGIFTRNRFGHFWLPRSKWGREMMKDRLENLSSLEAENCPF